MRVVPKARVADLHPALVPEDWDGEGRETADAALAAYIEREGMPTFQQVTSRGQYTHPDGMFYGGLGPVGRGAPSNHLPASI